MKITLKEDLVDVDWEVLADLYRKAYGGPMTALRTENIFRRSYLTRIAVVENKMVGAGYALSDGEMDATIHGIAVLPEFQRRGIGGQIMRSIVDGLPAHVAKLCTVDPQYEHIYRRLGFKKLKTAMGIGFPESHTE